MLGELAYPNRGLSSLSLTLQHTSLPTSFAPQFPLLPPSLVLSTLFLAPSLAPLSPSSSSPLSLVPSLPLSLAPLCPRSPSLLFFPALPRSSLSPLSLAPIFPRSPSLLFFPALPRSSFSPLSLAPLFPRSPSLLPFRSPLLLFLPSSLLSQE
jgi:hypothetical protein